MTMHEMLERAFERHANLRGLMERYPGQASSAYQTLLDLTHAARWTHVHLLDVNEIAGVKGAKEEREGILLYGLRPEMKGLEAVWSCSIADTLQTARFQTIFECLDRMNVEVHDEDGKSWPLLTDHFLLAVHAPDATVVYYNIARGLVKPVN